MEKKIPERMCIVCKTMQPKKNLLRIVKDKEGNVFVDNSYKANGRGAYICKTKECIEKCEKTKALNRAYKCEISASVFEEIKKNLD